MDNPHRVPVRVAVIFDEEGVITPTWVSTAEGKGMTIDKVLDVRSAAAYKAGGTGTRYTVRIGGKEYYLFHCLGNKWFIER